MSLSPAIAAARSYHIDTRPGLTVVRFEAMASPCELLLAGASPSDIEEAAHLCTQEAWRVEQRFSRYRSDNIVHAINQAGGAPVEVDDEMADLLDYAAVCHDLSGGLFDITSGVLRRVWKFDGSSCIPSPDAVAAVMTQVGWRRVRWQRPVLQLPDGMEIDLGGLGKEYAVDRAFAAVQAQLPHVAVLVNFGGDLRAGRPPEGEAVWHIGVENPQGNNEPARRIGLRDGALATSGDTHRFLMHEGRRLSHILDPRTGYPITGAPRSVTVAAPSCTEAGMLSTFAMLQGAHAESFLDAQNVRYWCLR